MILTRFSSSKTPLRIGLGSLLVLLLMLTSQVAIAAEVNSVRLGQTPDQTRVVFEVNTTESYHVMYLDHPPRIVIDFPKAQSRVSFRHQHFQDPRLSGIRMATDQQRTRIVLDLSASFEFKHFALAKTAQRPQRVVIDISQQPRVIPTIAESMFAKVDKPAKKVTQPDVVAQPKAKEKQVISASASKALVNKVPADNHQVATQPAVRDTLQQHARINKEFVIAIDPGHGGNDSGAIGPSGVYEKDVVLAIAKKMKRAIDQQPGMRAVLTRDRDVYVGLNERTKIARRHQADLFISVHADAFTSPKPRGASVYVLSNRGATSAMASALAARENEALGIVTVAGRNQDVALVLSDLSRDSSLQASKSMGSQILSTLNAQRFNLHKGSVQAANFAVLRSMDIPAILVEAAFISNPEDERLLVNPRFQQNYADSLAKGLSEFLAEHGSKPNWGEPIFVRHQIQAGDNLSSLAEIYGVSSRELIRLNGLRNPNQLVVGRSLRIPMTDKMTLHYHRTYRVKSGDSLSVIAQRYGARVQDIMHMNNLTNANQLRVGSELRIPIRQQFLAAS